MKCIHCQTDSTYKARAQGKCSQCEHRFAFEPKKGDTFTDPAFLALIERVSSGGTVKWTERHLYYEVVRRSQRSGRRPLIFGALALLTCLLGLVWTAFLFSVAGIFLLFAIFSWPSKLAGLSYAEFTRLLGRWSQTHGSPKGLIVRQASRRAGASARALPADIQHYSFDRAVVTDRRETADVLLSNNFHFENNCAILTVDGYPEEAFTVVRGMLKNNPKLAVFVVHDATPQGCGLAQQLVAEGWFQPSARIVDVGLGPEHAQPFKGCWRPAAGGDLPHSIDPRAREWLQHYSLELAVIRPEQIIKRLFRALSNSAELPLGEGSLFFIDSGAFGSDASASDGGGDSFG